MTAEALEARRKYWREYAKTHPKRVDPEKRREYQRKYRQRNIEKLRQREREYYAKNRDNFRAYQERYWTKKAQAAASGADNGSGTGGDAQ